MVRLNEQNEGHMSTKCLWICVLGLFAASANASTYYVNKAGSDGNSAATAKSPVDANAKLTIAGGWSCLAPGDTLIIGDGTYTEGDLNLPATLSGTSWATATVMKSENLRGAIWKPSAAFRNAIHIFWISRHHVIFDGIVFDGESTKANAAPIELIKFDGNVEAGLGFAHHIRFIRCEIRNAPYTALGIYSDGTAQPNEWGGNHEFIDNLIHNNGSNEFNNVFYVQSNNNLIRGNDIYDNFSTGVMVSCQNMARPTGNITEQNRIHGNGGGVGIAGASGNTFRNNLIYDNAPNGFQTTGAIDMHTSAPSSNFIYNNTIYKNVGCGIWLTGAGNVFKNNIVYGNEGIAAIYDPEKQSIVSNNVTVDPQFVNAALWDLRLKQGSPAIGAGLDLSGLGVKNDVAGISRPQGGSWDCGAYEYLAGAGMEWSRAPGRRGGESFVRSTRLGGIWITPGGVSEAQVSIYSLCGKKLALIEDFGTQGAMWNPGRNSTGVCVVRIQSGSDVNTAKIFLGR